MCPEVGGNNGNYDFVDRQFNQYLSRMMNKLMNEYRNEYYIKENIYKYEL